MTEAQAGTRLRAAVLGTAALLFLGGLGWVDANAPDEPRYLQVAEEMRSMEHGPEGLVLLHLNGEIYTQKPPLYYWLAAGLGAPLGRVTEAAGRLPSALSGLLTVLLVLRFGTRLFGGATGVLAAALLLGQFEFVKLARKVQLDVLLCLLESVALVAFWSWDRGLASRTRCIVVMHAAMGLAVLTKGPVGILVPLLVAALYLAWEGRLREIRGVLPPWALLLSVAPGLAWVAAAAALAPVGFTDDAVGANLIGRFFAGTSHARPFFYYLYQFPADFLPWVVLAPVVWWAARHQVFAAPGEKSEPVNPEVRRAWRFLLSWVAASLLFFSLSSGKRGLYMIPVFPAAVLLCADALVRYLAGRSSLPRPLAVGAAVTAVLAVLVGAEALLASAGMPLFLADEMSDLLHDPWLAAFGCALLGVAAGGSALWVVLRRNRAPLVSYPALVAGCAVVVQLAVFLLLFPALNPILSVRRIAVSAASVTPPGHPIGLVSDSAMVGGLVYYAARPVRELSEPEDVRRFLDEGGSTFVVKRRKLDRIEALTPVEVVSSSRSGRREVVVVTPRRQDQLPAVAAPSPHAPD